jgi:hypothetical protein
MVTNPFHNYVPKNHLISNKIIPFKDKKPIEIHKLAYYCPTSHLEAHTFSIAGMNKWLHPHAFSFKKPKGFLHKANPKLQEEFITVYEKLKDEECRDAPILFIDAVHPTQAIKLYYGWIRTGQTKHVETTGSRTRLNIVGAIQLGTMTAQYETINGESIIDFMTKLRGQHGSKIVH